MRFPAVIGSEELLARADARATAWVKGINPAAAPDHAKKFRRFAILFTWTTLIANLVRYASPDEWSVIRQGVTPHNLVRQCLASR